MVRHGNYQGSLSSLGAFLDSYFETSFELLDAGFGVEGVTL